MKKNFTLQSYTLLSTLDVFSFDTVYIYLSTQRAVIVPMDPEIELSVNGGFLRWKGQE